MKNSNSKNPCKKYELAITSYVLEQKMNISKGKLNAHLSTCQKCSRDLQEWQKSVSVLRAEAHDVKPKSKKIRTGLLSQIKRKRTTADTK